MVDALLVFEHEQQNGYGFNWDVTHLIHTLAFKKYLSASKLEEGLLE